MAELDQPNDNAARSGSDQPPQAAQSLVSQGPEYGADVVEYPPRGEEALRWRTTLANNNVANGSAGHVAVAVTACVPAANPNGMAAMGGGSVASDLTMAAEVSDARRTVPRRRRSPKGAPSVADGSVNPQAILALLERQQYRCALTTKALTPETASLDHIVPVCRGGEHRIENTQVLERTVNRAKGTLTNEEFITLCGEVWRHARHANSVNVSPSWKQSSEESS